MKAYVIPIEKACNAKCPFCITDYKNDIDFGSTLDIEDLHKLDNLDLDKIEISGGGEPLLHPQIDEIINFCAKKTNTQIYTNGSMLLKCHSLDKLSYLCISRAHYDDKRNEEIMGVKMDMPFSEISCPIKLSLVLCKSGISSVMELIKFLNWARSINAKKVVVRQVFDYDVSTLNDKYRELVNREYVSFDNLERDFTIGDFCLVVGNREIINCFTQDHIINEQGNVIFTRGQMEVEIEKRSCACEAFYPVLRANGKVYVGWTNQLWENR